LTLINDPILISNLDNVTLKIGENKDYPLTIQTNKAIGKSIKINCLDGSSDGIKVE